jgi:hypothetical protein
LECCGARNLSGSEHLQPVGFVSGHIQAGGFTAGTLLVNVEETISLVVFFMLDVLDDIAFQLQENSTWSWDPVIWT